MGNRRGGTNGGGRAATGASVPKPAGAAGTKSRGTKKKDELAGVSNDDISIFSAFTPLFLCIDCNKMI